MVRVHNDWHDYEKAAAAVLKRLRWKVAVQTTVRGARGKHRVDVYGRKKFSGFKCRCLVECKYWKRKVTKSVVLTFSAVMIDVGANFGLLVCENGFQKGARRAAEHTAITLASSLREFERAAKSSSKKNRGEPFSKEKKISSCRGLTEATTGDWSWRVLVTASLEDWLDGALGLARTGRAA
jgi:hypothetical protein